MRAGMRSSHQSVGEAYAAAGTLARLGHPSLGNALRLASTNAFLHGLTIGVLVAGGVAAAGAILAALFLPAQPAQPASPARSDRPAQAPGVSPLRPPASPDPVR